MAITAPNVSPPYMKLGIHSVSALAVEKPYGRLAGTTPSDSIGAPNRRRAGEYSAGGQKYPGRGGKGLMLPALRTSGRSPQARYAQRSVIRAPVVGPGRSFIDTANELTS